VPWRLIRINTVRRRAAVLIEIGAGLVESIGMASRQANARHFSVPAGELPKSQYDCQQKNWTSDIRDDRRRRSSSQRRYIDVVATPSELQGLLPPQTDEQGSEDYRTKGKGTW